METLLYLLYMATGRAPIIPLDEALRPTWLFGSTVHEGCDRGYLEYGPHCVDQSFSRTLLCPSKYLQPEPHNESLHECV
jgi:Ni,Fe-hydrogenase I small subunit